MLWPIIFDDETFYSFISRLADLNNFSPITIPFKRISDNSVRAADLQIDIDLLSKLTNGVYGTRAELVQKLNIFNPDAELITTSNSNKNIWRWCDSCAQEELETLGVCYWHRKFQHECVRACTKHGISLTEINIHFRNRQSKFILPDRARKFNGYQSCGYSVLETSLKIASNFERIESLGFEINLDVFHKSIEQKPLSMLFNEKLEKTLQLLTQDRLRTPSFLKSILIAKKSSRLHLPALIYLHFSSFDNFLASYGWEDAFNINTQGPNKLEMSSAQRSYREEFTKLKMNFPDSSKTDFWKMAPKTMRWLIKNDKDWIDSKFEDIKIQQMRFTKF